MVDFIIGFESLLLSEFQRILCNFKRDLFFTYKLSYMNFLQRMELWGDRHHPKWLDFIRIALGIFLFIKGIEFYNNLGAMMSLMEHQVPFNSLLLIMLAHYVIFAHIVGGLFLAFGIFTRVACIIQIPVLLGAIIFINSKGEMFRPFSELLLSILVFLLLIFFLVVGNGPWSAEHFFDEKKAAGRETV